MCYSWHHSIIVILVVVAVISRSNQSSYSTAEGVMDDVVRGKTNRGRYQFFPEKLLYEV